jgi:DNA-binding transcriptional LysR family regulator
VRFTVLTRTSDVVIDLLHQREIDVGVTYLDNDPVPDTTTVPLYHEHYLLLTTSDGPRGADKQIAWAELGSLPLCLFTREMQHRRIVDGLLRGAGVVVTPKAETDSLLALASYVQTGSWASIVPRSMISAMGLSSKMRAIPIVDPDVSHTIGLVVSQRFPAQPAIHSFMQEARARAAELLAIA